jgi:hypothetical protein
MPRGAAAAAHTECCACRWRCRSLEAPPLPDGGDAPPRPHWLNSRLGAEDDSVPSPYTPLQVNATTLPALFTLHGKTVAIGAAGLPLRVETYGASVSPSVEALRGPTAVLGEGGLTLAILANASSGASATPLDFAAWEVVGWGGNGSAWSWSVAATDTRGLARVQVWGSMEFCGYMAMVFALSGVGGGKWG